MPVPAGTFFTGSLIPLLTPIRLVASREADKLAWAATGDMSRYANRLAPMQLLLNSFDDYISQTRLDFGLNDPIVRSWNED